MSIWTSIKGLFGQTIHYKDGVRVGETWDGLVPGTKKHYGSDGTYRGYSREGFFGNDIHYDDEGERLGESWDGFFGTKNHYSDDEGYVGFTGSGFIGENSYLEDDVHTIFDEDEINDEDFDSSFDDIDY